MISQGEKSFSVQRAVGGWIVNHNTRSAEGVYNSTTLVFTNAPDLIEHLSAQINNEEG
jgi:hypothetical protein